MRFLAIIFIAACGFAATSHAQVAALDTSTIRGAQPAPQQWRTGVGHRCALASQYLKSGNCGEAGCAALLCVALQNGCRINHWGHVCPSDGMR
jgi:hypothetical protein